MTDEEKIREEFRRIRSLLQASRQRVATLRPVWSAYLAGETLSRLSEVVDELNADVGRRLAGHPATPSAPARRRRG